MDNTIKIMMELIGNAAVIKGLQTVKNQLNMFGKQINSVTSAISDSQARRGGWARPIEQVQASLGKTKPAMKTFSHRINGMIQGAKRAKQEFAGWAMSIMFFGMLIQRVFQQIWRVSTKVFQDVMHSVEGTVTPLDMMNQQLDILKYSVGSALSEAIQPLIPIIVELVEKISAWIQDNEVLFGRILLVVGILGTLFFLLGTLALAFNGFREAIILARIAFFTLSSAFSGAGSIAAALGLSSAITLLLTIAALVIAFVILWKTNFAGFRDFVKTMLGNIFNFFKDTFNNVKNFLSNIIGFITSIFTGEWDKALGYLVNALIDLAKIVVDIFFFIKTTIENAFAFVGNIMIATLTGVVKGLLSLWRFAREQLGLGTDGVDATIAKIDALKEKLSIDYTSYEDNESRNKVNDFLSGIQENVTTNIIINNPTEAEVEDAKRNPTQQSTANSFWTGI